MVLEEDQASSGGRLTLEEKLGGGLQGDGHDRQVKRVGLISQEYSRCNKNRSGD